MYVKQRQLLDLLSVSRTTLWRMVNRGDFPIPDRSNPRVLMWNREDIESWLDKL